jgi:hypothetical protein
LLLQRLGYPLNEVGANNGPPSAPTERRGPVQDTFVSGPYTLEGMERVKRSDSNFPIDFSYLYQKFTETVNSCVDVLLDAFIGPERGL